MYLIGMIHFHLLICINVKFVIFHSLSPLLASFLLIQPLSILPSPSLVAIRVLPPCMLFPLPPALSCPP